MPTSSRTGRVSSGRYLITKAENATALIETILVTIGAKSTPCPKIRKISLNATVSGRTMGMDHADGIQECSEATRPGFEPGKTGPKPVVIPFHHRVKKITAACIGIRILANLVTIEKARFAD